MYRYMTVIIWEVFSHYFFKYSFSLSLYPLGLPLYVCFTLGGIPKEYRVLSFFFIVFSFGFSNLILLIDFMAG